MRSAVLMGCPPNDAEDLVQTALTRCYIAWPKVNRADNRDAYVYRVLMNAHRDLYRRRRWREHLSASPPPTATVADASTGVDDTDAVNRALGDLTPQSRAVIVLRFYAGMTERQTAEALGVAVGTVKSRMSRALTQLAISRHLTDPADGRTS